MKRRKDRIRSLEQYFMLTFQPEPVQNRGGATEPAVDPFSQQALDQIQPEPRVTPRPAAPGRVMPSQAAIRGQGR